MGTISILGMNELALNEVREEFEQETGKEIKDILQPKSRTRGKLNQGAAEIIFQFSSENFDTIAILLGIWISKARSKKVKKLTIETTSDEGNVERIEIDESDISSTAPLPELIELIKKQIKL